MIRLLVATFSLISIQSYTQVGVNVSQPTRTLHINGNLRVSNLQNVSEDAAFEKILVTDANGNVDYALRSSFLPNTGVGAVDKESYIEIYNNNNASGLPERRLKCGKFFFIFETGADSNIKFGINEKPATNVNIYMNMEQNWNNGFQFYQGTNSTNGVNAPFTFTTSNYNVAQEFKSARLDSYEQNVMTFQYPGDADIYRLTIYKVQHTSSSYDFVSACEKF